MFFYTGQRKACFSCFNAESFLYENWIYLLFTSSNLKNLWSPVPFGVLFCFFSNVFLILSTVWCNKNQKMNTIVTVLFQEFFLYSDERPHGGSVEHSDVLTNLFSFFTHHGLRTWSETENSIATNHNWMYTVLSLK